jgi:hypothetical protein
MPRKCQVTGREGDDREQCFPRQQQDAAAESLSRTCRSSVLGSRRRDAGFVFASPRVESRRSIEAGIEKVLASIRARGEKVKPLAPAALPAHVCHLQFEAST